MSHVTTVETKITDLEALKAAAEEMGAQFVANVRTYRWYGRSVGDYPMPAGMSTADLGKCDHVIRVPGVEYEVGVVRQPDGSYRLAYDFWGPGQGLLRAFGDGCGKLAQRYAKHAVHRSFRARGYSVREVAGRKPGEIRLEVRKG